jgi:hypothetical protein
MRVYLAGSAAMLRRLVEGGPADGPIEGFAATESLVHSLGALAEEEDLEFALSLAAAEASAAAVGVGPGARGRRYVVVAEVDEDSVVADEDNPGAVTVQASVALTAVDAILADPDDVSLHAGVSDELAWFATQEIEDLLA